MKAADLNEPIRELIARCRVMPRGSKRSKLELELGKLLKKQDALLLLEMEREQSNQALPVL
jgi:hypothetical protein